MWGGNMSILWDIFKATARVIFYFYLAVMLLAIFLTFIGGFIYG